MTIMLRDNNKWDIIARDFIRVLIASAFRRDLDLRRYIEESAKKLNLRLRRRSFKGRVLHLTEYLALSFYHRTDDLLVYVAGCGDYRALLFNAMFSGLSTREIDKIDAFVTIVGSRLTLTSTTIRAQINLALDGLERAIENVMFWAEDDGIDDLDSMIQLRDWVMNVFLVGRLGNHGTAPRVISLSLKLLTRMMKIFLPDKFAPNQNICTASENLTSTAYVKLVHSLKECLCNSLRSYYYETIVAEFFHCARHLLALPCTLGVAEGTVTILSWACAPPTNSTDNISSEHSTYTYEVIIWLKVCGELLRHQATTKVLRDLLLQVNLNGDANTSSLDVAGPNYVSLKRFCSSLDTLNKLERDLTLQTAKNVLISNPYVGKSIGNTDIMSQHTLSGESLRAIDEYCRYLNSRGCDS
ncbi:hypothetical protein ACHAXA_000892 [Cyclostephanos tholiformis]|uniref:Uncharacterized protein n=1 Tax=Cyclostephanos tholiformis TaxID=382380 RepID=A0ABD3R382_9STRA